MKNKRSILCIAILSIVVSACKNKQKEEEKSDTKIELPSSTYTLIGKRAILNYPDMSVEVTYLSDSTLHWSQTDVDNNKTEDTEKIKYIQLNESQFFLNWIEKDGFTVSQVIDLKSNKVNAYLSFEDQESDRGKRTSQFLEGTVKILE